MGYIFANLQQAREAPGRRREGEKEKKMWQDIEMNNNIFPALNRAKILLKDTLRRGEVAPVAPRQFNPLATLAAAIPPAMPSAAAGSAAGGAAGGADGGGQHAAGNEGSLRLNEVPKIVERERAEWNARRGEQAEGAQPLQSPPPLKRKRRKSGEGKGGGRRKKSRQKRKRRRRKKSRRRQRGGGLKEKVNKNLHDILNNRERIDRNWSVVNGARRDIFFMDRNVRNAITDLEDLTRRITQLEGELNIRRSQQQPAPHTTTQSQRGGRRKKSRRKRNR